MWPQFINHMLGILVTRGRPACADTSGVYGIPFSAHGNETEVVDPSRIAGGDADGIGPIT